MFAEWPIRATCHRHPSARRPVVVMEGRAEVVWTQPPPASIVWPWRRHFRNWLCLPSHPCRQTDQVRAPRIALPASNEAFSMQAARAVATWVMAQRRCQIASRYKVDHNGSSRMGNFFPGWSNTDIHLGRSVYSGKHQQRVPYVVGHLQESLCLPANLNGLDDVGHAGCSSWLHAQHA